MPKENSLCSVIGGMTTFVGTQMSKLRFKFILLALCFCTPVYALQSASYDPATAAQATVIHAKSDTFSQNQNAFETAREHAATEVYSSKKLSAIIEDHSLFSVIRDQDRCQFTPDIEDRARLVRIPAFMFAWGDMLINGICVNKDEDLGLSYIKKAAQEAYGPALERMAFYYENGYMVEVDHKLSERYMHTSAVLGSKSGRLGWADMLVRGYGTPAMYEEAFSWLYHANYKDEYSKLKQKYLEEELSKRLPPEVVARNKQVAYEY